MNHPHDDDDVAHLQRLAYGADSTPEERQQAVDDLRTLATATDAPAGPSPSTEAAGATAAATDSVRAGGAAAPAGSGTASATAAAGSAPSSTDEPGAGRSLAIRIGVVAGAAALV